MNYKYIYLLLYKKHYMSRIIKVITEEENIQPPYLYIVKKSYKTHLLKISFSVKKRLAAQYYVKAQDRFCCVSLLEFGNFARSRKKI